MPRTRVWQIGAGLLSLVAAFIFVESAARVIDTVHQQLTTKDTTGRAPTWFVYSPVLGWERRPGYKGLVDRDYREFDQAGYLTADSKQVADRQAKRVIFMGDSSTMGYGATTESSFVEVVDRLLPDVDAINLGVLGYSSYQGRLALDKYLPLLKPDLVVVSFSANDRRYVIGPNEDGPTAFDRAYRASNSVATTLNGWLDLSYAYRLTRVIATRVGVLPDVQRVRVDAVKPRVDAEHYRANLSAMAESARRMGIPLVFLSLRDSPSSTAHLWKGIDKLNRSDYDAAIGDFKLVIAANGMFADLGRLYLSKAYAAKHEPQLAASALEADSSLSVHGGRFVELDRTYDDIMRRVATEYGAAVVDGAAVLDDHDYIDFCHFDADGHRKIGELLADWISKLVAHQNSVR